MRTLSLLCDDITVINELLRALDIPYGPRVKILSAIPALKAGARSQKKDKDPSGITIIRNANF